MGLILAMSSTAIVLQSLGEKGLLKTPGGEACFAVLLLQDIAVIPILAALPFLASHPVAGGDRRAGPGPDRRSSGVAAGVAGAGGACRGHRGGRALSAAAVLPLHRRGHGCAKCSPRRRCFIVVGIALLMQKLGLSPALGTFIAGVVLAESEYRVQLEADIEPFKGLLLGLFFISVGASIDFALMARQPGAIALIVAALILLKFAVLFGARARQFRLQTSDGFLLAFALAQGGEFAFVLFSFATQQAVLPPETANLLIAAVALSMAAAPALLVINERLVQPRFQRARPRRKADPIDEHDNPVILAGFGRFGHVVGRLLRANGFGDHRARFFGLSGFVIDISIRQIARASSSIWAFPALPAC